MSSTHISLTTLKKNISRVMSLLNADHCVLLVHNGKVLCQLKLIEDKTLKSERLNNEKSPKPQVIQQIQKSANPSEDQNPPPQGTPPQPTETVQKKQGGRIATHEELFGNDTGYHLDQDPDNFIDEKLARLLATDTKKLLEN